MIPSNEINSFVIFLIKSNLDFDVDKLRLLCVFYNSEAH